MSKVIVLNVKYLFDKTLNPTLKLDFKTSQRIQARLVKECKIKCSLCDQEFMKYDSQIKQRKARHERKHDQTKPHGSKNQTWGKVEWLEWYIGKKKWGTLIE